jgi:hypothetical protein
MAQPWTAPADEAEKNGGVAAGGPRSQDFRDRRTRMGYDVESDQAAMLLRLHTGLEGLARGIGQNDPDDDIGSAVTDGQHGGHLRNSAVTDGQHGGHLRKMFVGLATATVRRLSSCVNDMLREFVRAF